MQFPLTLTRSPIGGEGIKKELLTAPSPRRGPRAGVRGTYYVTICMRPSAKLLSIL